MKDVKKIDLKNCCFILVSGSREITDKAYVYRSLSKAIVKNKLFENFEKIIFVAGGNSKGVDSFIKEFARKWDCGYREFPANWEKYGKGAGIIRNSEMVSYCKNQQHYFCICIWNGISNGCHDVIKKWGKENIEVVTN